MPYPLSEPLNYWAGDWAWQADANMEGGGYWGPPHAQALSVLDFAGSPAFVPGTDRGVGIFATPDTVTLPSEYDLLGTGDCRDLAATNGMRNILRSRLGITGAIAGDKLADLFFDCLLSGDPANLDRAYPLMPGVSPTGPVLALHLGGHSLVRGETFKYGVHRHTNRVQAMIQRALGKLADDDASRDPQQIRAGKALDYECEKFGITDPDLLLPAKWKNKIHRRKRGTWFTDDFNRADASSLGSNWEASNALGSNLGIVSGRPTMNAAAGGSFEWWKTALSSSDNESLMREAYNLPGAPFSAQLRVICRVVRTSSTDAGNLYSFDHHGTQDYPAYHYQLRKLVSGSWTSLGTYDVNAAHTLKVRANGSTIKAFTNGTERISVTDTGIASGLYVGIGGFDAQTSGGKASFVSSSGNGWQGGDLLPDAPSGLSATAVSTSQINLSWTDNSGNETGFEVERSPNGSSSWTLITTTAANATSYSNTGLTAGTIYYYRVRATNGSGNSSYTSTASATTLTAQEIAVFDGATEITDGQAGAVDFGSAIVGDAALSKTFTIENTGETALVVPEVTLPAGYTFANLSWISGTIDPESEQDFSVEVATDTAGTFAGEIEIASNDASEATFSFPVTATITPPASSSRRWSGGHLDPRRA